MKLKQIGVLISALSLIFTLGAFAAVAEDRPHEGKVINLDKEAMMLSVQADKNDQFTLYYTETTKLKGDLAIEEVRVGDKVHFDYVQKDGKMWLTELKRTEKAKN